jgi:hypothetical protein
VKTVYPLLYGDDSVWDFEPMDIKMLAWPSSNSAIFKSLMGLYRPDLIIEVGSFLGASTYYLAAAHLEMVGIEPEIVCVDTWLGSAEHWESEHYRSLLDFKAGRPDFYRQFMSNMKNTSLDAIVTPFSIPSTQAAMFLKNKGVVADMVYIDAGHDYDSVRADINVWWDVVRNGGVLFGDDYREEAPGLVEAVLEFAGAHDGELKFDVFEDKWIFHKR